MPLSQECRSYIRDVLAWIVNLIDSQSVENSKAHLPIPAVSQISRPGINITAFEMTVARAAFDWIASKALARKAGYVYGGSWRTRIASMIRRGLLLRGPDGLKCAIDTSSL